MAVKKDHDPKANWLSRRFGKHAPEGAPGVAAKEAMMSHILPKDADTGKRRIGFTASMVTLNLVLGATNLTLGQGSEYETSTTVYDPAAIDMDYSIATHFDRAQNNTAAPDIPVGFIHDGEQYIIITEDGDHSLWHLTGRQNKERWRNTYEFVSNPEEAFFIIHNIQEELEDYIEGFTDLSADLPDQQMEFFRPYNVSTPYTVSEFSPDHLRDIPMDGARFNSLTNLQSNIGISPHWSMTAPYEQIAAQLGTISADIQQGEYPQKSDLDSTYIAPREETTTVIKHDNDITYYAGIFGLGFASLNLLILGAIGGNAYAQASAANRKRQRKTPAAKPQSPKQGTPKP